MHRRTICLWRCNGASHGMHPISTFYGHLKQCYPKYLHLTDQKGLQ